MKVLGGMGVDSLLERIDTSEVFEGSPPLEGPFWLVGVVKGVMRVRLWSSLDLVGLAAPSFCLEVGLSLF